MKFPVDFEEKVALPPAVDGKGYPYRLSAKDLMVNFRFAENLETYVAPISSDVLRLNVFRGDDGTRTLVLGAFRPSTGTHVLAAVNGVLKWLETEDCESSPD